MNRKTALTLAAVAFTSVALFGAVNQASAHHNVSYLKDRTVCVKHTNATSPTKRQCLRAYRTRVQAQAKRDAARWPARPVTTRDLKVRHIQYLKWANLALYEAGRGSGFWGVRWQTPTTWTWQGGLGIYQPNAPAVGSPYGNLGALEWQAQVLVAQRVADRWGLSAWEAYRKDTGRYWNAPTVR